MVEPLFRFNTPLAAGQTILLDGPEGHHAASVRRMRVGERVQLTNGLGMRARGVVTETQPKSISVQVDEVLIDKRPDLEFGLVQALAKGDRDELAIQAATELGASKVIPWQAERSISRWDESKSAKGVARWQTICDEAAKQSLRAWFPTVQEPMTTKELSYLGESLVILDPTASLALSELKLPSDGELLLVVGPEGGISEAELDLLEKAGAKRVHLGHGILRTSTAGVAAISYLAGATGQWR